MKAFAYSNRAFVDFPMIVFASMNFTMSRSRYRLVRSILTQANRPFFVQLNNVRGLTSRIFAVSTVDNSLSCTFASFCSVSILHIQSNLRLKILTPQRSNDIAIATGLRCVNRVAEIEGITQIRNSHVKGTSRLNWEKFKKMAVERQSPERAKVRPKFV